MNCWYCKKPMVNLGEWPDRDLKHIVNVYRCECGIVEREKVSGLKLVEMNGRLVEHPE